MEILLDDLYELMARILLPFVRLSALFLASPFFGARTIPVRLRVALAVLVTLVLLPGLPQAEPAQVFGTDWWLLTAQQALIGFGMGMILQIAMSAIVLAGQNVATAMGLSFASSVDPQNGVQAAVVGQIYLIFGTLIFLATDSHLMLLKALQESFSVYPLDTAGGFSVDFMADVLEFSGQMFETGLLISMPVLIGVLLINIGFGVMTKAAPQLNLFSIGFPMSMLGGFLLILVSLPSAFVAMEELFAVVMGVVFDTFGARI